MKKNVLVISQVIPQWYVDLLTRALGEQVNIDIITGSEVRGNVIHSPEHDARSFKSRLICWWKHYRFIKKWVANNQNKKYELVFAVSNPPINSFIGLKLKKIFHAPFVYMNWDLYPQVIEETIGNPVIRLICKCWNLWNSKNYPKIDRVLTIGSVMSESMTAPLKKKIDVTVLPIVVDTEYLKPIEKKDNPFAKQYGLTDKFVVLYSGKMGMGHNIELILEAAEKLKNNSIIEFVFIGSGPKYKAVEEFIFKHQSQNILLLPMQPDDIFPYSMACGDIGIVSQEAKMAHLFMPSKTYSMMACGEAIIGICSGNDDLQNLILENKLGEVISGGDSVRLAKTIEKMYEDRKLLNTYKENARSTTQKFSIDNITDRYRKLFEEVME